MRFVPTLVHGVIDYILGLIVIALPFMLALHGTARIALITLGVIAIL